MSISGQLPNLQDEAIFILSSPSEHNIEALDSDTLAERLDVADGEVENQPSQSFRVLLPDDDVLRALLKKAWLDALHEAFFLKSDEDELSVCYDCHADQCLDVLGINTVYGAAQLKVERSSDSGSHGSDG